MHLVFGNVFLSDGGEGAAAHMKGDMGKTNALGSEPFKQGLIEMQPGCWRGNRPGV